MSDFLVAIGLVLVIEGLVSAAFPIATVRAMLAAAQLRPSQLRAMGLLSAVMGICLVWLIRG
ncbi:DUF2065 domain-containing protein [Terrihabitans sp. B22-R8]|uniref:DUF2065 domain-containing protein n=1 Tax=Terrihabitans sp. B22-R8 TaxID=3425128 RepID=UPI00403C13C1